MREYIDRDKFREELVNTPFFPRCKTTPDLLTSVQDRLNDTLELLDNMPAADVRPVRRGRWIPFTSEAAGDIWYCSACDVGFAHHMDFCPHCGADMREEAEE